MSSPGTVTTEDQKTSVTGLSCGNWESSQDWAAQVVGPEIAEDSSNHPGAPWDRTASVSWEEQEEGKSRLAAVWGVAGRGSARRGCEDTGIRWCLGGNIVDVMATADAADAAGKGTR